jgi:hypothetical protein
MTEFHVGQEVEVLRDTDTLDAPWTKGEIVEAPLIGPVRATLAPGLYPVVCDGALEFYFEKFIRAI